MTSLLPASFRSLVNPLRTLSVLSVIAWTVACSSNGNHAVNSGATTDGAASNVAIAAKDEDKSGGTGTIIEAPSNLRNFAPKESAVVPTVAADLIDLRRVFEDLGPDATLWYQHVQTLSNPFFGGRAPETEGDELAARYIEFYFDLYGLDPAFQGDGSVPNFRQPFDFYHADPNMKVVEAVAAINGEELGSDDFTVLGIAGSARATGPVTFVGYGIADGQGGYSSFDADTDLTGRFALVLRYEPLDENGKSKWSPSRFSRHASVGPKMENIAKRGAAGIILVNPPGAVDGESGLETLRDSARFGQRLNIPVIQVTPDTAERILAAGDSQARDLLAWRKLADEGAIKTFDLQDSLQLTLAAKIEANDRLDTHNVAAVLPGKGDLADQWIVIGGHYDHLGFGYTGTMPGNVGQLHPGADDNASGIAGILIAARRLAEEYDQAEEGTDLRSVIFIAFTGEEAGLHGSKHFVEHPPMPLDSISLMINLDMIGRLRSNTLMAQGTGTAEGFDAILRPHIEESGLTIAASPGGRGPSDHSVFYGAKVPVLFLFTGTHDDYHRPGDRAYTVNPAGGIQIVDLFVSIAMDVASRREKLKFTESAGGGGARETGARVSLGTMPDYTAQLETGMRVESVRPSSSADEAGIQAGDVLLTWNGEEIAGAQSLATFLGRHSHGDRVSIVIRRDDQERTVEAVLKGVPRE